MKTMKTLLSSVLVATTIVTVQAQKPEMITQEPVMKMTSPTPASIMAPDNASLDAAESGGWHVVSMKNDWQRIFSFEEPK